MDGLSIVSAVVKLVFGAIFGFFIGAIVLLTDAGILGIIIGAMVLGYLLFAPSVVELIGALVLGFIFVAIGSYFGLVARVAASFPVAERLGQAPWVDTFFSLIAIYMVALIIFMIFFGKATGDVGLPQSFNVGCGVLIGLIFGGILLWGASSSQPDTLLSSWVLGGAVIGFLLSFMPGHPMM